MPQRVHNLVNDEWMWGDTFERRIQFKREGGRPIGEWSGLDRDGRQLRVVWVSSKWHPLRMLDVYAIYEDQDY